MVESSVEAYVGNLERYIKEVATVTKQLFHIIGKTFEQERFRFISMITAACGGGTGGQVKFSKCTMEHKVIHN